MLQHNIANLAIAKTPRAPKLVILPVPVLAHLVTVENCSARTPCAARRQNQEAAPATSRQSSNEMRHGHATDQQLFRVSQKLRREAPIMPSTRPASKADKEVSFFEGARFDGSHFERRILAAEPRRNEPRRTSKGATRS